MRLRAPVPLSLTLTVALAGLLPVGPANAAAAAPQVRVFGIPSAAPASQVYLRSDGFTPGESAGLTLVDTTDPSTTFALPPIVASDLGEVTSPIPLTLTPDDIVPGSYVLRIAQASGPSATSAPVTIAAPRVDVTGFAEPGGSLDLLLTGLGSRPGIVRSAQVDGVAVPLAVVQQHVNISSNPVVGPTTTSVTLPNDIRPGAHTLAISQVAPAAVAATILTVGEPSLQVRGVLTRNGSGRSAGSRGAIRVDSSGFGPTRVTLTLRDAAGHDHALPDLPPQGLDTVLPGLPVGTAFITARSTLINSTATDFIYVAPASVTSSSGLSSLPRLISPSGERSLALDVDRGIVVLDGLGGVAWQSPYPTAGRPLYRSVLQGDGNLVVYSETDRRAVWSSRTQSSDGPFTLTATDDGRAVLTSAHGGVLWATPTVATTTLAAGGVLRAGARFQNERHSLAVQSDGNVVLYSGSKVLFSTGSARNPGSRLVLQADGNLVVYSPAGKALWSNRVRSGAGSRLVLQADGNLVEYSATGRALWSTGTAQR